MDTEAGRGHVAQERASHRLPDGGRAAQPDLTHSSLFFAAERLQVPQVSEQSIEMKEELFSGNDEPQVIPLWLRKVLWTLTQRQRG